MDFNNGHLLHQDLQRSPDDPASGVGFTGNRVDHASVDMRPAGAENPIGLTQFSLQDSTNGGARRPLRMPCARWPSRVTSVALRPLRALAHLLLDDTRLYRALLLLFGLIGCIWLFVVWFRDTVPSGDVEQRAANAAEWHNYYNWAWKICPKLPQVDAKNASCAEARNLTQSAPPRPPMIASRFDQRLTKRLSDCLDAGASLESLLTKAEYFCHSEPTHAAYVNAAVPHHLKERGQSVAADFQMCSHAWLSDFSDPSVTVLESKSSPTLVTLGPNSSLAVRKRQEDDTHLPPFMRDIEDKQTAMTGAYAIATALLLVTVLNCVVVAYGWKRNPATQRKLFQRRPALPRWYFNTPARTSVLILATLSNASIMFGAVICTRMLPLARYIAAGSLLDRCLLEKATDQMLRSNDCGSILQRSALPLDGDAAATWAMWRAYVQERMQYFSTDDVSLMVLVIQGFLPLALSLWSPSESVLTHDDSEAQKIGKECEYTACRSYTALSEDERSHDQLRNG